MTYYAQNRPIDPMSAKVNSAEANRAMRLKKQYHFGGAHMERACIEHDINAQVYRLPDKDKMFHWSVVLTRGTVPPLPSMITQYLMGYAYTWESPIDSGHKRPQLPTAAAVIGAIITDTRMVEDYLDCEYPAEELAHDLGFAYGHTFDEMWADMLGNRRALRELLGEQYPVFERAYELDEGYADIWDDEDQAESPTITPDDLKPVTIMDVIQLAREAGMSDDDIMRDITKAMSGGQ